MSLVLAFSIHVKTSYLDKTIGTKVSIKGKKENLEAHERKVIITKKR
jgi:hypothetical protein